MNRLESETERIKQAYAKRDTKDKAARYAWHRQDVAYISCRQRATWSRALKKAGFKNLRSFEILDVGCGTGNWLRMVTEWGSSPHRLHGVDLLEDRIEKAKSISPHGVNFCVGNGWPLPYGDDSMDLCVASTVFSSILDEEAREALAEEMGRVAKPNGWIMIFDYAVSDPRNPDTIGIGRREIRKLLPALELVKTYKLILAPPILRRFPHYLLWLAYALETLCPFLCTHRLYVLRS